MISINIYPDVITTESSKMSALIAIRVNNNEVISGGGLKRNKQNLFKF